MRDFEGVMEKILLVGLGWELWFLFTVISCVCDCVCVSVSVLCVNVLLLCSVVVAVKGLVLFM